MLSDMRLRRATGRARPRDRADVIVDEDYAPSRQIRTWRSVLRRWRIVRHAPNFAYQASATAVGTLIAIAIAYLVGLAGGVVTAAPLAVILSIVGLAAVAVLIVFRLAPKRLLMARVSELLDSEPGRIVETLKKILEPDSYSDWDLFDAVWNLPEPKRTVLALRFGEPMTLAGIGDILGISSERGAARVPLRTPCRRCRRRRGRLGT
jgi:hypothetical protein